MSGVEKVKRPLNTRELTLLEGGRKRELGRLTNMRKNMFQLGLLMYLLFCALCIAATIADHKGPKWYISCLINAVWLPPLIYWAHRSARKDVLRRLHRFDSAIARNEAEETRVESSTVLKFEEIEDEGTGFAFEIGNLNFIFIIGQEIRETKRFPNSDFSVIEIYDDSRTLMETYTVNRGDKLTPAQTVGAKDKRKLPMPEHMEIVSLKLGEMLAKS
jgi:hypothetical protein